MNCDGGEIKPNISVTPASPAQKIPKPAYTGYCNYRLRTHASHHSLQSQMRLDHDIDAFSAFCNRVRYLEKKYLKPEIPPDQQDEVSFRNECMKIRGMHEYEDGWPIDIYLQFHTYQRAKNARSRLSSKKKPCNQAGREKGLSGDAPKEASGSSRKTTPRKPKLEAYVLVPPQPRRQRPVHAVHDHQRREIVVLEDSKDDLVIEVFPGRDAPAIVEPSRPIVVPARKPTESLAVVPIQVPPIQASSGPSSESTITSGTAEDVKAFLKSINPPQDELLPYFVDEGIVNSEYILATAQSIEIRKSFLGRLREEKKISRIQHALLEEAFKQLASR